MPLPKTRTYTSADYWNLPDGNRAELIGGQLYAMAPPSRIHQQIISELISLIHQYIAAHNGDCKVYPAPFAVNLDADDKDWVEPDISVICDKNKLTDRGCSGAPDLIIEIVSPSSRRLDYSIKNALYSGAGVREYWIIDLAKERTTVYRYEEDDAPELCPFHSPIHSGVFAGLAVTVSDYMD